MEAVAVFEFSGLSEERERCDGVAGTVANRTEGDVPLLWTASMLRNCADRSHRHACTLV